MGKFSQMTFWPHQRGDWKERLKNQVFSGGQFKYPAGVVLSISGGGVIIWLAF